MSKENEGKYFKLNDSEVEEINAGSIWVGSQNGMFCPECFGYFFKDGIPEDECCPFCKVKLQ